MRCFATIENLVSVLLLAAVLGVIVIGIVSLKQDRGMKNSTGKPEDADYSDPHGDSTPAALPQPTTAPAPPSLEQRITNSDQHLSLLMRNAVKAMEATAASEDLDSALRQLSNDLVTMAEGHEGAINIGDQLKQELSFISEKTESIKSNVFLSPSEKSELSKLLAAQVSTAQKALDQANTFCSLVHTLQSKEIPQWISTYSHFVNIYGSEEAKRRISSRISTRADQLAAADMLSINSPIQNGSRLDSSSSRSQKIRKQ
jgi:hypothetical protein